MAVTHPLLRSCPWEPPPGPPPELPWPQPDPSRALEAIEGISRRSVEPLIRRYLPSPGALSNGKGAAGVAPANREV